MLLQWSHVHFSQPSLQITSKLSAGRLDLSSLSLPRFNLALLRPPRIDLAACRSISTLNLSHNRLTDLPPLSLLGEMRHLNVSHNRIGCFKCDLPPALETIDLGYNRIKIVIGGFAGCTMLQFMNFESNPTKGVAGLEHLTSLHELNLRNCNIPNASALRSLSMNLNLRHLYKSERSRLNYV